MPHGMHDLAVFIGRFQPFHAGHASILAQSGAIARKTLVLVGSSLRPRSWKNPFTFSERRKFIMAAAKDSGVDVTVLPLVDTLYDDLEWSANVRTAVRHALRANGLDGGASIVLVGHEKDGTSQYQNWFPEFEREPFPAHAPGGVCLNATDLRERLFFGGDVSAFGLQETERVRRWMNTHPDEVEAIVEEATFVRDYRARTSAAEQVYGYPIPINTVDAVVVQSGHVLLVERGQAPGKGLLALPGGHIEPTETATAAVVRELYEETRLDMPRARLAALMTDRRVFDHPSRSERGWVRTEAFLFQLEDRATLERVKGGSDAVRAGWVALSDLDPSRMFEDHFDLVQAMTKGVGFSYAALLLGFGAQR